MSKSLPWLQCVLLAGLFCAGDAQAQSPSGSSRIVNERGTFEGPQCLEAAGNRGDTFAPMTVGPCHDGSRQRFRLLDNNLASTRIAVDSGSYERCLAWAAESNTVFATGCGPQYAPPKWKVREDGKFQLLLPPDMTIGYDACLSTKISGYTLRVYGCDYNDSEIFGTNWHLPPPAHWPVMFRNLYSGNCLTVDVWEGQRALNTPLIHDTCSSPSAIWAGAGQVFQVREASPGKGAVITVYQGDETLCIANESLGIRAVPCKPFAAAQQWRVTALPGGANILTSQLWVDGWRCLDASGSSPDVIAGACHGGAHQQHWGLYP